MNGFWSVMVIGLLTNIPSLAFADDEGDAMIAMENMGEQRSETLGEESSATSAKSSADSEGDDARAAYAAYQMEHGTNSTVEGYIAAGDALFAEGDAKLTRGSDLLADGEVHKEDADEFYLEEEWLCTIGAAQTAEHYFEVSLIYLLGATNRFIGAFAQYENALYAMQETVIPR